MMEKFANGWWLGLPVALVLALPTVVRAESCDAIVVGNEAELVAAMVPANACRRIVLRNRFADPTVLDYQVHGRLTVPDGATVEGSGTMRYTSDGLPSGFEPSTETRVGPASTYANADGRPEIFGLGDGSRLRRLTVVSPRPGSAVGILSRPCGPVTASVSECDVFGPGLVGDASNFGDAGGDGVLGAGPLGRGVFVRTRHRGSCVTARIDRSIVHADGTNGAVYVVNLTAGARITVFLTQNVIKDGLRQLDVVGGAGLSGRPDANGNFRNDGNTTVVHSRCNLYAGRGSMKDVGVILEGGFDGRGFRLERRPGSNRNSVHFHSERDRIEGVGIGVLAQAAMRTNMLAEPSSFNRVDLRLVGTTIRTLPPPSPGTKPVPHDLSLCVTRGVETLTTPAGEGCSIHALVQDVEGKGDRVYAFACGPQPLGPDNTFAFAGDGPAFQPIVP